MFFKRCLRPVAATLSLAAVSVWGLQGCGIKIGERPDTDITLKLGSAETACLSGAARTLVDYFEGGTTDQEISDLFSCASRSIQLFQERTRGATRGVYTPDELRKFLERYFLRDFTVSDGFKNESMALKRTLLGGSETSLTSDELRRLRVLLDALRDQSIRLRPYLPLTPTHVRKMSTQELDRAIELLKSAAYSLGLLIEERATPYSFSSLERLLQEVEQFLEERDSGAQDTAEIRRYLPLFRSLKRILVSPDGNQMEGSDWRVLLTTGADFYAETLRLVHSLEQNKNELISGPGRAEMTQIAKRSFDLILEVISRNPQQTVSYCDIYSVIDQVGELVGKKNDLQTLISKNFEGYPIFLRKYLDPKMVPSGGSPILEDDVDYLTYFEYGEYRIYRGTIKRFLQPFIQKFLRPVVDERVTDVTEKRFDFWKACEPAHRSKGLRAENIARVWEMFEIFSEGQRFTEKAFHWAGGFYGHSNPMSRRYLPQDLLGWTNLSDLYPEVPAGGSLGKIADQAIAIMQGTVRAHRPLFSAGDIEIRFNAGDSNHHDFTGLTLLNGIYGVVRQAWIAYNPDPNRPIVAPGGVNLDELNQFFDDTSELGMSLKLYDPNGVNVAAKRFLEANLFTYAANGDNYLSLEEGQDLVAFLISAKALSSKTYALVRKQCWKWNEAPCPAASSKGTTRASLAAFDPSGKGDEPGCHIGSKDLFDHERISAACWNAMAYKPQGFVQQIWDHMPNLRDYYLGLSSIEEGKGKSGVVYQETFRCLIEQVARSVDSDPLWYDSGDPDLTSALYHYLEAMFVGYDSNRNGTLERNEVARAYPVLANVLKTTSKSLGIGFLKSDADFQAILHHLLATGQIPSASSWKGIWNGIQFLGEWLIVDRNYKADRARVLQIMALVTGRDTSACFSNPKR